MKKLVFLLLFFLVSCSFSGFQSKDPVEEFLNGEGPSGQIIVNPAPVQQANNLDEIKLSRSVCGDNVCNFDETKYSCPNDCWLGPKSEQVEDCVIPELQGRQAWIVDKDVVLCHGTHNFPFGIEITESAILDCNGAVLKSPSNKYLSVLANNVIVKNCLFEKLMIDIGGNYNNRGYIKLSGVQLINNNFNVGYEVIPGYEVALHTIGSLVKNNNFFNKSGVSLRSAEKTLIVNNNLDYAELLSSKNNEVKNNRVDSFIVMDDSEKNIISLNKIKNSNFSGSITLMNSYDNFINSNELGDYSDKSSSIDCNNVLDRMGIPLLPIGLLGGGKNIISNNLLKGDSSSCGIFIDQSKGNKISENTIEYFDQGILLSGLPKAGNENNEISNNLIKNNKAGVFIKDQSRNNKFSNNSFVENERQVNYNTTLPNFFKGNFFDNFKGTGPFFVYNITPKYETGWVPLIIQDETPRQDSN
ncbi:right-handed parallel beta-helix repeat-containing protein [archaeon]|nr:right-handed parallel beta-helix repeat-containing protein [archaeon]